MEIIRQMRKPRLASCSWMNADTGCANTQTTGVWWGYPNSPCFGRMGIRLYSGSVGLVGLTIKGGWFPEQPVGFSAPYSNYYVRCGFGTPHVSEYFYTYERMGIIVDLWKALDEGLWSSSVSFEVYGSKSVAYGGSSPEFYLQVGRSEIMPPQNNNTYIPLAKLKTQLFLDAGSYLECPTKKIANITVYDDGRFSIS